MAYIVEETAASHQKMSTPTLKQKKRKSEYLQNYFDAVL